MEEERPRRLRREPGGQDCFPVPLTFDAALARGLVHYFGAELAASSLSEAMPFTVGDNQTYRGFWNPPLEPRKAYLIYFQATSHLKGVRGRLGSRRGDRLGTLWSRGLRRPETLGLHRLRIPPPLVDPCPLVAPPTHSCTPEPRPPLLSPAP